MSEVQFWIKRPAKTPFWAGQGSLVRHCVTHNCSRFGGLYLRKNELPFESYMKWAKIASAILLRRKRESICSDLQKHEFIYEY